MKKWHFVINIVWALISSGLILVLSTQDKEWFIDGEGINNICDVMKYVENDDVRFGGMLMTLPLFFPYLYVLFKKKREGIFQYVVMASIVFFGLWRFIFRYQLCW